MAKNFREITEEIRKIVAELFAEDKVNKVIAFGQEEYTDDITPIFISNKEDTDKILFNPKCSMMLAKYLLNYPNEKIAIVAKPCDSRAINSYLAEGLLQKENLQIIGIDGCEGVEDNSACQECTVRNALNADYNVGEKQKEEISPQIANNLDKMTAKERIEYFRKEFSRCIRCYACREACHVCNCPECFVDSNQPQWVEDHDNFTFHLMRSMHMAGRCINCGACEMACPEGIDVRALTSKLNHSAKEMFDYQPGMSPTGKTLLTEYELNDPEPGFIE